MDEGVLDSERPVCVVDLVVVVLHLVLVKDKEPRRRVDHQGLEAVTPVERPVERGKDLGPRDPAAGRHVDNVAGTCRGEATDGASGLSFARRAKGGGGVHWGWGRGRRRGRGRDLLRILLPPGAADGGGGALLEPGEGGARIGGAGEEEGGEGEAELHGGHETARR